MLSRILKLDWHSTWRVMRDVMKVHKHFIKYDNMPQGSKLIYSLPCAHYFINSYIVIVPAGSALLLYNVLYYNKRLFFLKKEDFREDEALTTPNEFYALMISVFLLVAISVKITHEWPIRIYKGKNNQYTALFINKYLPFYVKKFNFDEAAKAKTLKLSILHDNKYILDNKRTIGLFDYYFEPPIEYFQMLTPKHLKKPSSSS